MTYKLDHGWMTEVSGIRVIKRDVGLATTYYNNRRPIGILFHFTAGCGSDISGVLKSRGISVTFSVDREGTVYEYIPVAAAGWHAFSASHAYLGIEHTALPGTCDLTDVQLEASAKLSAAVVEWNEEHNGFLIPVRKLDPPVTATPFFPGFLDHRDGDDSWNQNGHTDHLYRWTWDEYLAAVSDALSGGDVGYNDFKRGWQAFRAGENLPAAPDPDFAFGYRAAQYAASNPKADPILPAAPHTHSFSGTTEAA